MAWAPPPDYSENHKPKCGTEHHHFYTVNWEERSGKFFDPERNVYAGNILYNGEPSQPSHKFWWNRICHDDTLGKTRRPPPPPLRGIAAKRPADGQPSDSQPASRPALATASTPVPAGKELTAQHVVNELAALKSYMQGAAERLESLEMKWGMYLDTLFPRAPPVPPRPTLAPIEDESQGLE